MEDQKKRHSKIASPLFLGEISLFIIPNNKAGLTPLAYAFVVRTVGQIATTFPSFIQGEQ